MLKFAPRGRACARGVRGALGAAQVLKLTGITGMEDLVVA